MRQKKDKKRNDGKEGKERQETEKGNREMRLHLSIKS